MVYLSFIYLFIFFADFSFDFFVFIFVIAVGFICFQNKERFLQSLFVICLPK